MSFTTLSWTLQFQSTLLMRGVTYYHADDMQRGLFQSTLLMRGVTAGIGRELDPTTVSIHTPHARSDTRWAIVFIH